MTVEHSRTVRFPASAEGLAGTARIRELLASRPCDTTRSIAERREESIATSAPSAARIAVEPDIVGGVAVERHSAFPVTADGMLLFAHGGAFVTGSPQTHRGLAAHIATAAGLPLLSIDYRLAPEWPFPAGRDDVVKVYEALIQSGETTICLVGDSAGGGVMMQAALAIRDAGLPPPAAIAVTSPWVDLACRGASHDTWRESDMMLSTAGLTLDGSRYLGGRSADDPCVSPLHADLSGLPPVLIQVGEHEILADDASRLAKALESAGVPVELEIWEGMTHAWYAFRGMIPESEAAIMHLAAFLKHALSPALSAD